MPMCIGAHGEVVVGWNLRVCTTKRRIPMNKALLVIGGGLLGVALIAIINRVPTVRRIVLGA
jgi:hypothetical protein